jgi:hypothetical protein
MYCPYSFHLCCSKDLLGVGLFKFNKKCICWRMNCKGKLNFRKQELKFRMRSSENLQIIPTPTCSEKLHLSQKGNIFKPPLPCPESTAAPECTCCSGWPFVRTLISNRKSSSYRLPHKIFQPAQMVAASNVFTRCHGPKEVCIRVVTHFDLIC